MEFVFDYNGRHIACYLNERLYSFNGRQIGQYLPHQKIFIDMEGHYLGQIPFTNRLLHSNIYSYEDIVFEPVVDCGNIGNIGNIGLIGSIERMEEFSDIDKDKFYFNAIEI